MQAYTERTRTPVTRDMGLTGQLVVGGTVSTGLLLGGYAVGLLGLAGRTSGHALLVTSLGLFLVGALAGLVLSTAIGLVGRAEGVTLDAAAREVGKGVLYAIPATTIGAVVAGWIAMATVALYLGKIGPLVGSAVAALIAALVMLATARLTWEAAVNAAHRARLAWQGDPGIRAARAATA
jgi:hypothetical protein